MPLLTTFKKRNLAMKKIKSKKLKKYFKNLTYDKHGIINKNPTKSVCFDTMGWYLITIPSKIILKLVL